VRNVDATADFSMQVSILRFGASLGDGASNIFVGDSDRGRATELKDHSCWMKMIWDSPSDLLMFFTMDGIQMKFGNLELIIIFQLKNLKENGLGRRYIGL